MKVMITTPTIIGGIFYDPAPYPQNVPDAVGQHLCEIGNATPYETKVVEPVEKKTVKTSSVSQPAQVLPEKTPKKRGRPRKKATDES